MQRLFSCRSNHVRPHKEMVAALPVLLAALGAVVLTFAYYRHALNGAGMFAQLAAVQLSVVVALFLTYLAVLWVALIILRRLTGLNSQAPSWTLIGVLLVTATIASWGAPLIPFLIVMLMCVTQATCPEAANPISWSFLALIGPRELPFSPAWVVIATVAAALAIGSRGRSKVGEA